MLEPDKTVILVKSERHQVLLALILFICGFLGVQRFALNPINAAICVVPYVMFVMNTHQGNQRAAVSCLLVALLLSVDNGAGVHAETVSLVRYVIYVTVIAVLFYFSRWRVRKQTLAVAVLFCFGILFGSLQTSLLVEVPIDAARMKQDLIVLFILSIFLLERSSVRLDLQLVYICSLGYLAGEVLNGLFLYKDHNDYLSYNSLKSFIVFPLTYSMLTRKNIVIKAALAVLTLYILFLYGTRMIVLSVILFVIAASIIYTFRNKCGRGPVIFLILSLAWMTFNIVKIDNNSEFLKFKAIAFLFQIIDTLKNSEILQVLAMLDPVRFAEHQLFFDQSILQIIFGSGLGSGIYDPKGLLGFVTMDQTAFSDVEISSSTYFGFHDFWIDFGLRFGILSVAYLVVKLSITPMWHRQYGKGFLFGVLLINTTFSMAGIIFLILLVRLWPEQISFAQFEVNTALRPN